MPAGSARLSGAKKGLEQHTRPMLSRTCDTGVRADENVSPAAASFAHGSHLLALKGTATT